MFKEMRLIEQQLSYEEAEHIMKRGTYGVLALEGEGNRPYAVPLNYCYDSGKIYFHCASEGYKLECIAGNRNASFAVVEKSDIVAEEFNCLFTSVIAFGEITVTESPEQKQEILRKIIGKYSPEHREGGDAYIAAELDNVVTFVLDVEHMTGKKGI